MSDKQPRLTRTERGQVRRFSNRLFTIERREFPSSSSPGTVYETVVHTDGKVLCNCRGWTIKKEGKPRQCKHTQQVIDGRPVRADGEYLYLILPGGTP